MQSTEVTRELQRIQSLHGGLLRAADVVKEAKPKASPLHRYFQWDDTKAAHQWRLEQARQLIRVCVTYLPYQEPKYEVRAFISLSPDRTVPKGGYRVMAQVLAAPSDRAQMLADALAELDRLRIKYHVLTELDGVFRSIERAARNYGSPPPPPNSDSGGDSATV